MYLRDILHRCGLGLVLAQVILTARSLPMMNVDVVTWRLLSDHPLKTETFTHDIHHFIDRISNTLIFPFTNFRSYKIKSPHIKQNEIGLLSVY